MKKLFIAACVAVASITIFSACGNKAPKAEMKNEIDSLSYAFGLAQTDGLRENMEQYLGVDTAYIDEFIKGLIEGANAGDDKKHAAYMAGLSLGGQIANQAIPGINQQLFGQDSTKTVSLKNILAGFITGCKGQKGQMTIEQARTYFEARMMKAQEKVRKEQQAAAEKQAMQQYGDKKKASDAFLAANAKKEGVKTLPSGVQYRVITEGKGPKPTKDNVIKVNYEGKFIDGNVFDSSEKHGGASEMPVSGAIPGWVEVVQMMPVGSKWEVVIPYDQAYGADGGGRMEPFSTLVFTIEIVDIVK